MLSLFYLGLLPPFASLGQMFVRCVFSIFFSSPSFFSLPVSNGYVRILCGVVRFSLNCLNSSALSAVWISAGTANPKVSWLFGPSILSIITVCIADLTDLDSRHGLQDLQIILKSERSGAFAKPSIPPFFVTFQCTSRHNGLAAALCLHNNVTRAALEFEALWR